MPGLTKTILGVFAHPDDESMGPGGTLCKYASAGHRVAFVTATDGGAGRLFEERPGDNTELRGLRRRETARAAEILGVEFLGFLGWEDGRLADLNVLEVETRIAEVFRRVKPDVIITFHGSGISYHPDHRVISLAVSGAFRGAGRPEWYGEASVEQLGAHSPSKLYHYTVRRSLIERVAWPRAVYASSDDEITTVIDTSGLSERRWRAIQAHETQKNGPPFELLREAGAFAEECFVRVSPTPCPGNPIETDLLEGLDER